MAGSPRKRAKREGASLHAETAEKLKPDEWKPNPGPQEMFVRCPVEDIFFGGARGGGKTQGLIGDWLRHSTTYGAAATGLLLRRTYDQLIAEVQYKHLMPLLPKMGAVWHDKRSTWTMANGATLRLKYLDSLSDAEQYQGGEYNFIGTDELGNFPSPEPIDRLRGAMRSTAGVRCVMRATGNPGGPGQEWIKARYITPAPPCTEFVDPETVDPKTGRGLTRIFIPSNLSDTPQLYADPEQRAQYLANLRASGPAWLVDAWLNGNFDASAEGGMIQPEWLNRRYKTDLGIEANRHRFITGCTTVVLSIDTAVKPGASNDWSVCEAWGIADNNFFLMDVWRDKVGFPELRRAIVSMRDKWRPSVVIIEDASSGASLIQDLRSMSSWGSTPIHPVKPKPGENKELRFGRNVGYFESGLIVLPLAAPWLLDWESEIKLFPICAHDDQVDATSQFLDWYTAHQRYVRPVVRQFSQSILDR